MGFSLRCDCYDLLQGNSSFQSGNYADAISLYSSAIDADPSNQYSYLNRSQANLKLGRWAELIPSFWVVDSKQACRWSQAEQDATKTLELQPDNPKALYRRAVAKREQGNFEGAREG